MGNRNQISGTNRSIRLHQNVFPQKRFRHAASLSQRTRGLEKNQQSAFAPPEQWYEPRDDDAMSAHSFTLPFRRPERVTDTY